MKKIILFFLTLVCISYTFAQTNEILTSNVKLEKPLAIRDTVVVVYEHSNFTGKEQTARSSGHTPGNHWLSQFNDIGSSVKVPKGMVAILYEHANENGGYGNYVELMEDCQDLTIYNLNDKISYVTVFYSTRPGYNYVRTKNKNGKLIPGHWERAGLNAPDNSPPGLVQVKQIQVTEPKPVLDESIPVFRIQVRLVTGTLENDDTDKEVYVKFNDRDQGYFLDYGRDDFERGSDFKYDIVSTTVRKVSDIEFLEIGAMGSDVWGIKKIELYLNNCAAPVFVKVFDQSHRIDGGGSYPKSVLFRKGDLRANVNWQRIATDANMRKPPIPISSDMIKSMVESIIGNQLHYRGEGKLFWGNKAGINTVSGNHIDMKRKDGNRLNFNLDLEVEITGTNPAVDVDFDLVFECDPYGSVVIKTENVKSSCDFDFKIIEPSCGTIRSLINGALGLVYLDRYKVDDFSQKANTFKAVFILGGEQKCKGVQVTPLSDVFVY